MSYLIKVMDKEGDDQGFVMTMDFEINGPNYPTGHLETTYDPDCAMMFDSMGEAYFFITTRSKTCPTRPDGKPNRPLTAYTCEVINATDSRRVDRKFG